MNPFVIIAIILIIYIVISKCRNNVERFTQFKPIDWKDQSKERCVDLGTDRKAINLDLTTCKYQNDLGQRDALNSKLECHDATDRDIFNRRERSSWCASMAGKRTYDKEMLGAEPSKIMDTVSRPLPQIPLIAEAQEKVILPIRGKDATNLNLINGGVYTGHYEMLDNMGFNGYDGQKAFASY